MLGACCYFQHDFNSPPVRSRLYSACSTLRIASLMSYCCAVHTCDLDRYAAGLYFRSMCSSKDGHQGRNPLPGSHRRAAVDAVTRVHPLTRKDWKRQCTLPCRWCSRDVGEFASSSVAQRWTYISCVFAVLDCVMAIFYRKYSCIGAVVMHCRIVQPMQH